MYRSSALTPHRASFASSMSFSESSSNYSYGIGNDMPIIGTATNRPARSLTQPTSGVTCSERPLFFIQGDAPRNTGAPFLALTAINSSRAPYQGLGDGSPFWAAHRQQRDVLVTELNTLRLEIKKREKNFKLPGTAGKVKAHLQRLKSEFARVCDEIAILEADALKIQILESDPEGIAARRATEMKFISGKARRVAHAAKLDVDRWEARYMRDTRKLAKRVVNHSCKVAGWDKFATRRAAAWQQLDLLQGQLDAVPNQDPMKRIHLTSEIVGLHNEIKSIDLESKRLYAKQLRDRADRLGALTQQEIDFSEQLGAAAHLSNPPALLSEAAHHADEPLQMLMPDADAFVIHLPPAEEAPAQPDAAWSSPHINRSASQWFIRGGTPDASPSVRLVGSPFGSPFASPFRSPSTGKRRHPENSPQFSPADIDSPFKRASIGTHNVSPSPSRQFDFGSFVLTDNESLSTQPNFDSLALDSNVYPELSNFEESNRRSSVENDAAREASRYVNVSISSSASGTEY